MNQVFGNLIENAVKYGKSGRRILVGARELEGEIEFFVQDFGPGIASEHLGRIFERFYRVDKARSREAGGTGLGLAIVKHIVHAHGGHIRAESELGSGHHIPVYLAGGSLKTSTGRAFRRCRWWRETTPKSRKIRKLPAFQIPVTLPSDNRVRQ